MSTKKRQQEIIMLKGNHVHNDVLSMRQLAQMISGKSLPVMTQEMVDDGDELCDNIMTAFINSDPFGLRRLRKHLQKQHLEMGNAKRGYQ